MSRQPGALTGRGALAPNGRPVPGSTPPPAPRLGMCVPRCTLRVRGCHAGRCQTSQRRRSHKRSRQSCGRCAPAWHACLCHCLRCPRRQHVLTFGCETYVQISASVSFLPLLESRCECGRGSHCTSQQLPRPAHKPVSTHLRSGHWHAPDAPSPIGHVRAAAAAFTAAPLLPRPH